jgi:hypothetical protein
MKARLHEYSKIPVSRGMCVNVHECKLMEKGGRCLTPKDVLSGQQPTQCSDQYVTDLVTI